MGFVSAVFASDWCRFFFVQKSYVFCLVTQWRVSDVFIFLQYFPLSAIILFGSLSAIFFQLDLTFCYLFVILFHRLLLPSRGPTNQYVFVISNPLNKPSVIPWYSCYSAIATAQNRHQSMTVGKELCPLY